jgi:hypothetical protein
LTRLAFNHRRPHALSIASVTSHNASHVSDLPPKTPNITIRNFCIAVPHHATALQPPFYPAASSTARTTLATPSSLRMRNATCRAPSRRRVSSRHCRTRSRSTALACDPAPPCRGSAPTAQHSHERDANRNVGDYRRAVAHGAVTRRPPISLYTIVARTHMYTCAANVWDLSIVQGHSLSPRAIPQCYDSQLFHRSRTHLSG